MSIQSIEGGRRNGTRPPATSSIRVADVNPPSRLESANCSADLASRTARKRDEEGGRIPSSVAYSTPTSDGTPVAETAYDALFDITRARFPARTAWAEQAIDSKLRNRILQAARLSERLDGERDERNQQASKLRISLDTERNALVSKRDKEMRVLTDTLADEIRESADADQEAATACAKAFVVYNPVDPAATPLPKYENVSNEAIAGELALPYEPADEKPNEWYWIASSAVVGIPVGISLAVISHSVSAATWSTNPITLCWWPVGALACYAGKFTIYRLFQILGPQVNSKATVARSGPGVRPRLLVRVNAGGIRWTSEQSALDFFDSPSLIPQFASIGTAWQGCSVERYFEA